MGDMDNLTTAFYRHASQLNETEWETVLQNSGVFYGWRIDIENNRIVRATKPGLLYKNNDSH